MFVKVRGPDCERIEIVTIALSMQVKEFKEKVAKLFHVEPENQRLIHRGKQLEDAYRLYDYGVNINDVLQLTVKQNTIQKEIVTEGQEPLSIEKRLQNLPQIPESHHFKVGEYVDFLDPYFGAWFQGKVKIIYVEDQARLDAINKKIDSSTQMSGEWKDDNASQFVGDDDDNPFASCIIQILSREEAYDEEVDVVTVRSSSPESVIYIPNDDASVIYISDDEPVACIPEDPVVYSPPEEPIAYVPPSEPLTYVHPDSDGRQTGGTDMSTQTSNENEQGELQEITCDQSSDKINVTNDRDHSESGDSGHSSHMSLKNSSESNGQAECEGTSSDGVEPDDGCVYEIINLNNVDNIEMICKLSEIRPISHKRLKLEDIKRGQTVLVNYSAEGADKVGYWYDFTVSKIVKGSKNKYLLGDVQVLGRSPCQLNKMKITRVDEIWQIENLALLREREDFSNLHKVEKRAVRALCSNCGDDPLAKCTACSCRLCGMKNEPSKQVMCDECDAPYHIWCLTPPLAEVPDIDHWFCDNCKLDRNEIVKAGDKPKISKKKEQKPAVTSTFKWGQGMANVGLTKRCTIVPPDHFGPIPGVEVGTSWRFRIQASEAGVHRPPVGGMHGRDGIGAFSIVLSGGYEDDEDFGEYFWYTGAGGRDLSGNRRTSGQSCDQLFTHTNKALAINCNAPLSDEGAKAENWREGKPVRVLRSYKFRKLSEYAPDEGIRYDGIYKVVEYRPEKGRSGFIVWRYFLRRDDPAPAPWTEAGKMLIESLGLRIQNPENYEMALLKKKLEKSSKTPSKKHEMTEEEEIDLKKRIKAEPYEIDPVLEQLIAKDEQNMRLWESCSLSLKQGKKKYFEVVMENFMCICCQELVFQPITTPCSHNFCLDCMQRSFKAEVYTCPTCREDLTKNYQFVVNEHLFQALKALFPGYEPRKLLTVEQGTV